MIKRSVLSMLCFVGLLMGDLSGAMASVSQPKIKTVKATKEQGKKESSEPHNNQFYSSKIKFMVVIPHYVRYELIRKQKLKPSEILVVFDDDNTLLTTPKQCSSPYALGCQYLGGVAWYRWQMDLLKNQPRSLDLVAHTTLGLARIQNFLNTVTPMELVESGLPSRISSLQRMGVSVMIETARSPRMASATWQQLKLNHLSFSERPFRNGSVSYLLPPRACGKASWRQQLVSVEHGIFYVSGRSKGKMLQCLLRYTRNLDRYKAIVFVDDEAENIRSFRHVFPSRYKLSVFRYTRMDRKVDAFSNGPMRFQYQAQATMRWHRILRALTRTLPALTFQYVSIPH